MTLRFDDCLEEEQFKERFILNRVATTRAFIILSAALYYSFFIWDRMIDPVSWETAHFIRGAFVAPVMLGAAILLGFKSMKAIAEWLVLVSWILAAVGLSLIYSILARGFDYGAVGIVLVIMSAPMMMALRLPFVVFGCVSAGAIFLTVHAVADNSRPGMLFVNALCVGTAVVIVCFSSFVHEREARRRFLLEKELEAAQQRVDELLHSILPRDIVKRIQDGETAIADAYGEVSIVFADLVGFTDISRRITATHLVELLNRIFSEFDALADINHIEKIKTIGDAYMAVGGLTRSDNVDHVTRAALFALSAQEASKNLAIETGLPFGIRVGLHVGPVVAGVIGLKRPAFDCWGESVNLASRLESHAQPGGILVSETAYWRLHSRFNIEILEEASLKGIGQQKIFLLKSEKLDDGRIDPTNLPSSHV